MTTREHLLVLLIEECAEVQQCATKALRFGLDDIKPGQDLDNQERLNEETHDLSAIIHMLQDEGTIPYRTVIKYRKRLEAKRTKVAHFMEYSRKKGTLQ